MRYLILSLLMAPLASYCQELFTYTEPASNMAAKSVGFRLNNSFMKASTQTNYHLVPEIMAGVNKKLMLHAEAFISNKSGSLKYEGLGFYAKYRFYSEDEVHSHFRMAAFARYAKNNSEIHSHAIDLNMYSSGYEGGVIATKLINKVAVSGAVSFLHAGDNGERKFSTQSGLRNAVAYTFAIGKLMLPKEYVNYEQTNVNLMLEFLGQTNMGSSNGFVDIAPSVQFIILSRMRADFGYRFAIVNDLERMAEKGFLFRLEYNIFNAFK